MGLMGTHQLFLMRLANSLAENLRYAVGSAFAFLRWLLVRAWRTLVSVSCCWSSKCLCHVAGSVLFSKARTYTHFVYFLAFACRSDEHFQLGRLRLKPRPTGRVTIFNLNVVPLDE